PRGQGLPYWPARPHSQSGQGIGGGNRPLRDTRRCCRDPQRHGHTGRHRYLNQPESKHMIRVLLIVDEPAWRRLLEEQLASRCELVPGGGGALSQPFDAAIVDRLALARLEGSILARKEADGPLHLPFILAVAGHELRSMAPAPAAIDECLAMPPAAEELRARL